MTAEARERRPVDQGGVPTTHSVTGESSSPVDVAAGGGVSAAVELTRFGPVVPIYGVVDGRCMCGHADCGDAGKHPWSRRGGAPSGLIDASADPAVIAQWEMNCPGCNWAIATGHVVDVLDLDHFDPTSQTDPADDPIHTLEAAGFGALVEWLAYGELGPVAFTGSGRHVLVRATGERNRNQGRAGMPMFVDYRGAGGYVIAPPSRHRNGNTYSWMDEFPADRPIPEAPAELLELLHATGPHYRPASEPVLPVTKLNPADGDGTRYGLAALRRACDTIANAAEKTRNTTLYDQAYSIYRLVAGGEIAEPLADDCLFDAGRAVGLTDREIAKTLGSASRRGQQRPRRAA